MKNFVKISMMLLVSQMAMGVHNNNSPQTSYTKRFNNLKITTTFLSEKHRASHDNVREKAFETLVYNDMLHHHSEGTLKIIELQNLNDRINISTPRNFRTGEIRIEIQADADSPKSYFSCAYALNE